MGGVPMTLNDMKANGTGTITSDLSRLVPTQFKMDFQMEMNSEIAMGNKKQPIAMKMGINFTMEAN
jgi:hypothetical protein